MQNLQLNLPAIISYFIFQQIFQLFQIIISYRLMDIAFNLISRGLISEVKSEAASVQKRVDFSQIQSKIHQETRNARHSVKKTGRSRNIQAYFIGPRGQNIPFLKYLIQKAVDSQQSARQEYEMQDSIHITRKMKNEQSFLNAQDALERALTNLLTKLKDLSLPFFSSRYFGHMNWQTTIPSIVANFATLLYNPNNCAFEASPVTTLLQIQVIKQFAKMFQYPKMLGFSDQKNPQNQNSWGHLTCGGTISNCQALWAARNCRFLCLSVRKFIQSTEQGSPARSLTVKLPNGTDKRVLDLSGWEILNVSNEESTNVYDSCFKAVYGENIDKYSSYQKAISELSIGDRGLLDMYDWIHQINQTTPSPIWKTKVPKPIVFGSATGHYSLKKSLSILGFGKDAYHSVVVDLDSRISITSLRQKLDQCLERHVPVLAVIAIVGTTEESTVDNVSEILAIRKQYSLKGLYFHVHIDGAYGAYFVSLRRNQENELNSISEYVEQQLDSFKWADSITFDPHKTGYVPYSCGGIIYRNHRLKDNLSFSAPYIYSGVEPNMAIYGVEGSKPGSSVAGLYLSLQVLPLVRRGHGAILQRTLMNTKVFTASLYRVKQIPVEYKHEKGTLHEKFECLLLPRLYHEKTNDPTLKESQFSAIKNISEFSLDQLDKLLSSNDENFDKFYYNLGPDLNIVCFGLNFYDSNTQKPNMSLKKYNEFNRAFIKLSKAVGTDVSVRMKDLYVSETEINRKDYGPEIFDDFLKRHNLQRQEGQQIIVLIRSTIMNAFFTEIAEGQKITNESPNRVFVRELVQNGCQTLLYLNWR